MSDRFFCDTPITGGSAELTGAEAHHLLHVMRLKVGDAVTLFDGGGAEFHARVTRCGRREAALEVLARHEIDRELPTPLTIAAALPKGDRQRWMVEKLTELGATRLDLIETERSVARLAGGGIERLRRVVIEACKQCRRNRLMQVSGPTAWPAYAARQTAAGRFIAHVAEGEPPAAAAFAGAAGMVIAIGPEGGFTSDEHARAVESGWATLCLGPRVLRTETAATAAATLAAATIQSAADGLGTEG
ncbi:MAG: 16S rRNA (uracil(1498)-N(3))-methyltransferase [Planctomycetota bacterium]